MCIDPNRRAGARAFTLLEVAIGVTVLAVLAGTMFTIVQGSLQAAGEIQIVQRDNRRIERYVTLLRQYFRTLPTNATMGLKLIERSPVMQEITFHGAPEMFVWGEQPVNREPLTLSLRRYPEAMVTPDTPEFYLGLTRPAFFRPKPGEGLREALMSASVTYPVGPRDLPIVADEKTRYWLPIVPALRSMTWRFYQTEKKRWVEESSPTRPPLVELVLLPYERNTPIRVVFATR